MLGGVRQLTTLLLLLPCYQDTSGYCAGEYATASKNQAIVEMLMEWGVQAELLLGARDRWVCSS